MAVHITGPAHCDRPLQGLQLAPPRTAMVCRQASPGNFSRFVRLKRRPFDQNGGHDFSFTVGVATSSAFRLWRLRARPGGAMVRAVTKLNALPIAAASSSGWPVQQRPRLRWAAKPRAGWGPRQPSGHGAVEAGQQAWRLYRHRHYASIILTAAHCVAGNRQVAVAYKEGGSHVLQRVAARAVNPASRPRRASRSIWRWCVWTARCPPGSGR